MATVLKAQQKNAASFARAERKGKGIASSSFHDDDVKDEKASTAVNGTPHSKRNKQRVLLVSSRGATTRMRHLMKDIESLLPHAKKDAKVDAKSQMSLLPELCDLNNCNNCLFFEARRHEDLYMWAVKAPNGPSIRFLVQNIHTMDELKMAGNCLKGSRGLLSFDAGFDQSEHLRLMKEVLTHIFGVPSGARRTKPFIDHILSFSVVDNRIWFRNFQILEKDLSLPVGPPQMSLVEIGPRFVLTPIKIFEGAFHGAVVYLNNDFISPAQLRKMGSQKKVDKYRAKQFAVQERERRKAARTRDEDDLSISKVFA